MNGVYVRDNENVERALSRFKRVCESAGILSEIKSRRHFEKPSEVKKRQKKNVERRAQLNKLIAEGKIIPRKSNRA